MDMSGEAMRIGLMIAGLAAGMVVPLTGGAIVGLSRGMVGFSVDMCTEVRMIAVVVLEVAVPASYAKDVRPGTMIDVLALTVIGIVGSGIGVDVLAGVAARIWTATLTALEFMLASSEEALRSGWEACSCWPTAAWNCRVSQARMPSFHV